MKKGAGKTRRYKLTAGVMVMLCTCVLAYAQNQTLNVQEITLPIGGQFYSYTVKNGGNLSLPSTIGGLMKTSGGGWDYTINGSVSMSSAFVDDTSGEYASANFRGGRTLTVTGTIKYKQTDANIYSGTILKANMIIDVNHTWGLCESASNTISGSIDFLPDTSIGLGQGITYGTDTLKLTEYFNCDFLFKGLTSNPANFNTSPMTLTGTSSTMYMAAAPEPSTLLLFTTVALALRMRIRRKKQLS